MSSVQYYHQKGIAHRDLMAENLLFDADLIIKMPDLGLSNEFTFGTNWIPSVAVPLVLP